MTLAAQSIGYLVPRGDFAGRVHSVYTRACNIAHDGALRGETGTWIEG